MVPLGAFIIVPSSPATGTPPNVRTTFTGPWGGVKVTMVYMFILGLVGVRHGGL